MQKNPEKSHSVFKSHKNKTIRKQIVHNLLHQKGTLEIDSVWRVRAHDEKRITKNIKIEFRSYRSRWVRVL